jgi:hypothetical protein
VLLAGIAAFVIAGSGRPATIGAEPIDQKDESPSIRQALAEARVELALRALTSIHKRINAGAAMPNRDRMIAVWSRRLLIAQLGVADGAASRSTFVEEHLAQMKELEAGAINQYRERRISDLERMEMEFYRLDAEWLSAKAKSGQPLYPVWVSN